MTAITEDYVSFETAKLLKEKGFDASEIDAYFPFVYYSDGKMNFYDDDNPLFVCEAITLQMAMKWLREAYNINIDIVSIWNQKQFEYQVFVITPENAKHCYIDDKLYLGYEEAVEAGIKYCLKHLVK